MFKTCLTACPKLPEVWVDSRWHWLWSWQRWGQLWPWAGYWAHDRFYSQATGLPQVKLCHPFSSAPGVTGSLKQQIIQKKIILASNKNLIFHYFSIFQNKFCKEQYIYSFFMNNAYEETYIHTCVYILLYRIIRRESGNMYCLPKCKCYKNKTKQKNTVEKIFMQSNSPNCKASWYLLVSK